MFIEYVVFGILVLAGILAAALGMQRRRRDAPSDDPLAPVPPFGEGTSSAYLGQGVDRHGADFNGGLDGGGESSGDGSAGGQGS